MDSGEGGEGNEDGGEVVRKPVVSAEERGDLARRAASPYPISDDVIKAAGRDRGAVDDLRRSSCAHRAFDSADKRDAEPVGSNHHASPPPVADIMEVIASSNAGSVDDENRRHTPHRPSSSVVSAGPVASDLELALGWQPKKAAAAVADELSFWLQPNWGEEDKGKKDNEGEEEEKEEEEKEEEKKEEEEEKPQHDFLYSCGLSFPRLKENGKIALTQCGIDKWKQLWRVLELSDLLVTVVDARDPLFYRCPDLEAYAKEIDEHKRTMLLVNKADLLPLNIRKRWADYFKAHDILYVFWSAKAATATLEGKKLSGYSEEESASHDLDTNIYGRDELLMRLQSEAESIVAQRMTISPEEDYDISSSDSVSSVGKHVVVGFIGYPDVGKSSTINALVGEKGVFTHTPGKIKLSLCENPGVILPCFSISRHKIPFGEATCINQLALSNLSKKVNSGLDDVKNVRLKWNKGIYRLKILADDVRVWMQSSDPVDAQILTEPYINIGKEIVRFNREKDGLTERLKEMICDMEALCSKLYSKQGLFGNIDGQLLRLYDEHCLAEVIDDTSRIVKALKLLVYHLVQRGGGHCVLSNELWRLDEEVQMYKTQLIYTLKRVMKEFRTPPVPEDGAIFCGPNTNGILIAIEMMLRQESSFPNGAPDTVVTLTSPSFAKEKFCRITSDLRKQSVFKFVREVNPLYKDMNNLISDEMDAKCTCCFDKDGLYFTTCCDVILCSFCAEKNIALWCKVVHKLGVTLHFPVIVRKPILK